jgi:aldehyde dehydrogenase (NAD+)
MYTNLLKKLDILDMNSGCSTGQEWIKSDTSKVLEITSPIDGEQLAKVQTCSNDDYQEVKKQAKRAYEVWRNVPAPKRGEIVRQIGLKLREHKEDLGQLVTVEMGKSIQEGYGEVQEMIDICDFAVGLSRQLYGFTMHSEHRMYDQYHPIGLVGIISAFNFPVAVYAWNAMIAAVCGDVCIWKPSSKVPLTAIATQKIIAKVLKDNDLPEGIFNLVIGSGRDVGEAMLEDKEVGLISITGSTRVGRHANEVVARRFGKVICELGGNNAIIITKKSDLQLAIPGIVFGAVGTCGQRCTSTRRVINHVGPMIDTDAVAMYENAIQQVKDQGGKILCGDGVLKGKGFEAGTYVKPTICEVTNDMAIVQEETFAPILYLIKYSGDVEDAIAIQNDVVQGLSSAIFTQDMREAELFLSCRGSDCGIANVNIGTSGAEIGGAFGGEKETGGGRESGSDAWKGYMRRQTNTINYSKELPLAQGIKFNI